MTGQNPWHVLADAEAERKRLADELAAATATVVAAARKLHDTYGESWDSIGDALGIHRQTAYERFRQRPGPRGGR